MRQALRRLDTVPLPPTRERVPARRPLHPIAVGPYAPQLVRLVRHPVTLSGARPRRILVRPERERLGGRDA